MLVGLCSHTNPVRAPCYLTVDRTLTQLRACSCSLCVFSASWRGSVRTVPGKSNNLVLSAGDKRQVSNATMPFLVRLLSDSHTALRHQSCTILYHLFESRTLHLVCANCMPTIHIESTHSTFVDHHGAKPMLNLLSNEAGPGSQVWALGAIGRLTASRTNLPLSIHDDTRCSWRVLCLGKCWPGDLFAGRHYFARCANSVGHQHPQRPWRHPQQVPARGAGGKADTC